MRICRLRQCAQMCKKYVHLTSTKSSQLTEKKPGLNQTLVLLSEHLFELFEVFVEALILLSKEITTDRPTNQLTDQRANQRATQKY